MPEPFDTIRRVNSNPTMGVGELQSTLGVLDVHRYDGDLEALRARRRVLTQLKALGVEPAPTSAYAVMRRLRSGVQVPAADLLAMEAQLVRDLGQHGETKEIVASLSEVRRVIDRTGTRIKAAQATVPTRRGVSASPIVPAGQLVTAPEASLRGLVWAGLGLALLGALALLLAYHGPNSTPEERVAAVTSPSVEGTTTAPTYVAPTPRTYTPPVGVAPYVPLTPVAPSTSIAATAAGGRSRVGTPLPYRDDNDGIATITLNGVRTAPVPGHSAPERYLILDLTITGTGSTPVSWGPNDLGWTYADTAMETDPGFRNEADRQTWGRDLNADYRSFMPLDPLPYSGTLESGQTARGIAIMRAGGPGPYLVFVGSIVPGERTAQWLVP